MLANKDMDAELIWPICAQGEDDEVLYRLLNRWMLDTNPITRDFIWNDIQAYYRSAGSENHVERA